MNRLDDLTTVVLAPNPSPMTLDGTNTYLLGAPGSGEVVVVDPGPDLIAHRERVDAAVATLQARVVAVVVTHHHADHAEAAPWADDWGASLHAFAPALVTGHPGSVVGEPLRDGETLARAGVALEALHTPGHSADHLCLRVAESGVVLTGDHVLGRGSTMVGWPDGDMVDYLDSLRRLAAVGPTALLPGHGPVIDDPVAVIAAYLAHREDREKEVLAALEAGARTAAEVVARVYADVDQALHPAAERSVAAHLAKLVAEGRADPAVAPRV